MSQTKDSAAQQQVLLIRGVIASAPTEDQLKIKAAEAELRAVLLKHGDHALAALALLGAELAAE